jgi:hypothetical protein
LTQGANLYWDILLKKRKGEDMRLVCTISVILCFLFTARAALAVEGRYQAVPCGDSGQFSILILDTQEGHFWTWFKQSRGELSVSRTMYEGQVKPGSKVGEIIQETIIEEGKKLRMPLGRP